MKTILAFFLSAALISMMISSHASAMEAKPSDAEKVMKKMTDKKMDDKKDTKKKEIKKKPVKKKTTEKMTDKMPDKKKMTDKKMMDKKMSDHKMSEKPKMIGGVDISMASPIQGSADAKLTIIEFGDYQCPKCYSWFTKEKPTIESQYIAPGKANLIFVDLSFLGADSDSAVIASYCADEQGKYWQYHNKLYSSQGGIGSGWASTENLKKFATDLGLDSTQFNSCLDSGKYSDRIKHNLSVASSAGAQGTPTFLIVGPNGETEKISGSQPASVFSGVIDKYLK
ncbi:DsbA family protein [Candidatus Nitrosotenuis aquarius]|uniref:DsbA family protein n=1 Tax=Candidatus Nitrosotenuis aquarius TaxID=1846278 RepID=UPI000C1E188F|nr:DsbA family protein [Candidatus Nitrosotenuis aquarius]